MHAHKRMGEPGSWNTIPVIEHPQQSGYQFRASTTHRGNDLWMFVALDLNNSESQSDIWYRKWSGAAGSWGPATQVTFDQAQNRQPNTVWEISPGATSIPLMYWKGGNSVYTETVPIGGAGEVPDGAGLGENGLVVHKAPGTDLLLLWDPSCLTGDSDYGIYEGAIGHFASHLPNVCTTFGQTSETITPSSGNRYFLIVPQGNLKEGAYGLASSHLSRAPSSSPCREQEIMGCP